MSAGIEHNYRFKVNLLLIIVNFVDIFGILIILSMKENEEFQIFTFSVSPILVRFPPPLTFGFNTSSHKEAEHLGLR